MRAHQLFAALAVMIASPALLIAACKSSDDPEDAGPTPADIAAPTATAPLPAATGTVPAATPTPAAPAAPAKASPAQPAAGTKADAGAAPDGGDGGAPKDGGATGTPDAGALSGKLAACAAKCQSILQTCLTPKFPADGGLPQIENPAACQKSFDDCRDACAP
ncbi:hypothetical protein WMF20_19705 [Sorangium sp. So ce834]|uniref:hypothetical protein n=1 Tax=Sorangium sp. So ce834 TaxID=3133321 RepID=UPI003F61ACC3